MHLELKHPSGIFALNAQNARNVWSLDRDGEKLEIKVLGTAGSEVEFRFEGRRIQAHAVRDGARRLVFIAGRVHEFTLVDDEYGDAESAADAAGPNLLAQMPGTVVKLLVSVGDKVVEGAPLLIVEAMKMESEISAPLSGRVQAIHVEAGEVIKQGAALIDLEPEAQEGGD